MLVGGVDAEKPFVLSGSSANANAADTNLIASAFNFVVAIALYCACVRACGCGHLLALASKLASRIPT